MENCLEECSTPPQVNEVVLFVIPRSYMPTRGVVGYANKTSLNTTSTIQWGVGSTHSTQLAVVAGPITCCTAHGTAHRLQKTHLW
jgi:hypothetical protein